MIGQIFRKPDFSKPPTRDEGGGSYFLSSPFGKVGDGNLSLPFVEKRYTRLGAVSFGANNDFPQLIDQSYYTSPLHSSIIDFTVRATIGGGYKLESRDDKMSTLVKVKAFEHRYKLPLMVEKIARELKMHYRHYSVIRFQVDEGGRYAIPIEIIPVEAAEVRVWPDRKTYSICEDWKTQVGKFDIRKYDPSSLDEYQLFVYEKMTAGQKYYPIPPYTSANNWFFLDGETSFFHKTNIQRSIFPSFAIFFPKKAQDPEEKEEVRRKIEGLRGAGNTGFIFSFFAGSPDLMPKLENIPTNNNDQLFEQTDKRTDEKICQAHTIDPILMGIRVPGSLGSGTDIKQSYTIFEKNQVIPRREEVEEIINDYLKMFGIPAVFSLNNFQIVNETIVQLNDEHGTVQAIKELPAELQKAAIASLTKDEVRKFIKLGPTEGGSAFVSGDKQEAAAGEQVQANSQAPINETLQGLSAAANMDMLRIIRDYNKGRMTELLAVRRLNAYGIGDEEAKQILKEQ